VRNGILAGGVPHRRREWKKSRRINKWRDETVYPDEEERRGEMKQSTHLTGEKVE